MNNEFIRFIKSESRHNNRFRTDIVGRKGSLYTEDAPDPRNLGYLNAPIAIEDHRFRSEDDKAMFDHLMELMYDVLDEREIIIIRSRFNLNGKGYKTQKQIGDAINLSRERVGQIEFLAFQKLAFAYLDVLAKKNDIAKAFVLDDKTLILRLLEKYKSQLSPEEYVKIKNHYTEGNPDFMGNNPDLYQFNSGMGKLAIALIREIDND